ncbi:MAG: hypothetical protein OHK0013_41890 [Sandaracinaceae bacterium]
MEYVPGESLLKAMAEGPFSPARALDIAEQAASALARAHQMGVIHRDLKPENLLLVQRRDRPDFVKLLDFGIAKLTDQPSLTGSQQIFGTPGYIAPEYIQSANIDGRSDLYSLGVILYEMVTGALPFDYEYPGDLLIKHVTEPPIRPSVRRPGLPAPIEELVLRCLAKSPDDRFRDAFHFLEELRAVRERLGDDLSWGGLAKPASSGGQRPVSVAPTPSAPPSVRPAAAAAPYEVALPPPPEPTPTVLSSMPRTAQPSGSVASPVAGQRGRPVTADYTRRSIPNAPAEDLSIDVEIAFEEVDPGSAPIAEAPAPLRSATGELAGARRWRERFDALRAGLDDLEATRTPPPEVEHAMAFAARTLEALEEAAAAAQREQRALEAVSQRARDFRGTIGRTLDELAAQASHEKGELDRLAAQRVALVARRDQLQEQGRETEADGVLWEIAAVDQTLGEKAAMHEVLANQVEELQSQLERENEQLEREIAVLSQSLDRAMERLWPMAGALREPLDKVEAYVRSAWASLPG